MISIRKGPRSRRLVSRYSTVLLPIVEITNSMLIQMKDHHIRYREHGGAGGEGSEAIKLVSGKLKKFFPEGGCRRGCH